MDRQALRQIAWSAVSLLLIGYAVYLMMRYFRLI